MLTNHIRCWTLDYEHFADGYEQPETRHLTPSGTRHPQPDTRHQETFKVTTFNKDVTIPP
ncbi:MAG: hypothetical protein DRQ39_10885 [Gammaproteobacteria bacterium]|nr:MAG: hypothetical protein DRQ39_10885 [Gammaproteobacteria bacterium]